MDYRSFRNGLSEFSEWTIGVFGMDYRSFRNGHSIYDKNVFKNSV
jgi:hypothetical protein